MFEVRERLNDLLQRYYRDEVAETEAVEMLDLLRVGYDGDEDLIEKILESTRSNQDLIVLPDSNWARMWGAIEHAMKKPVTVHRVHFLKTAWFRYAAIFLLLLGAGAYLWLPLHNQPQTLTKDSKYKHLPTDIPPGGNRAILTLANGSTIVLDSAANGSLAQQGGTQIIKLNSGSLAYKNASNSTDKIGMNTISIPRGGQYQIILPDNSKVWLNAASSITFPTAFVKDRQVTVTGEAFFEVVKDKTKPFFVKIADLAEIEVLGTSFNINSYSDEPATKITLLEGSVKVMKDVLKPGQQSRINPDGSVHLTDIANIDQVIAWKNKTFDVNDKTLQELMRQIARWYDVEIIYEGKPRMRPYYGEIGMDLTLAECLRGLERMQVHCRLQEGRRLIVYP